MEAVAGLSLAANVLQVVDFASKLLSTGQQIYQAGSTVQNFELEVVVKDFEVLNKRLQSWSRPDPAVFGPLSDDDQVRMDRLRICATADNPLQRLEALTLESAKIAQELITVLRDLHLNEDASRYKSYLQAIRSVWNSKKIAETKQRLDEVQKALQFRIQVSMKEDILQSVDDATRQVLITVLQGRDEIVMQQQTSNMLALKRHDQIVNIISNTYDTNVRPSDVLDRIKAQLHYQRQDDRFEDIVEAHEETFRWALEENNNTSSSWPSLYDWLREGQGVYWVSGKAGSGKSTLMKFLHQDPRLQEALKLWAGNAQLYIVSFYFWNPGTDLQRSQEGLFRSLLYQILEQEASLARVLFAEQFIASAKWSEFPTFHELRRAFRRLTTLNDPSIKIALLVDGLDEFDAVSLTMTELAEIFMTATKSPYVKALLSSRPLAPFEFAFQNLPKLRLHQLTQNDIASYVNDKLAKHSRMVQLSMDDAEDVQALVAEITESASGVFLWVKLVVRSLMEGLQNYDCLSDLQTRLRALPSDLEELFAHMLRKVPTEYKAECSRIIKIAQYMREQNVLLSVLTLRFAEADDDAVLGAKICILSEVERHKYEEEATGKLRSRCAGLLEVNSHHDDVNPFEPTVQFLHKSVADFLEKDVVQKNIEAHLIGINFDAPTALLRSSLLQTKLMAPDFGPVSKELLNMVDFAVQHARVLEWTTKTAALTLLDELDRIMSTHFQSAQKTRDMERLSETAGGLITTWCDCYAIFHENPRREPWHESFLAFAISNRLELYAKSKLRDLGEAGLQKEGRPLLDYACDERGSTGVIFGGSNIDMVEMLLQLGADPNQKWGKGRSMWQTVIRSESRVFYTWLAKLRLLVMYGLDPNSLLDYGEEGGVIYRQSALRSVKSGIESFMDDSSYRRAYYWRQKSSVEFKPAADELIQLLIARGAREEEWHMMEDGSFKQVYPESSQSMGNRLGAASSGGEKSTRNPLKRMAYRFKRSLSKKH
jgi:hypothetical protein